MDEELKNYLDKIENNLVLKINDCNDNIKNIGQNIRNDFSKRFDKLELTVKADKNIQKVIINKMGSNIDDIFDTLEENQLTFRG